MAGTAIVGARAEQVGHQVELGVQVLRAGPGQIGGGTEEKTAASTSFDIAYDRGDQLHTTVTRPARRGDGPAGVSPTQRVRGAAPDGDKLVAPELRRIDEILGKASGAVAGPGGEAMTPETRWLLSCLRALDGKGSLPLPPASLNWNILLAFAEAHGLAPALGFALKAAPPGTVPAAARERLARQLADSMARHLILSGELGRLLRRFEAAGVPVMPLKGPVLAEALYRHPALRPFSDLDLLVRPEDVLRADGLLQGLDCRRLADTHSWAFDIAYDQATVYEGPAGFRVDLHWGLVNDPRYAWNHREGLAVWDRAIRIRVAGEETLGLCPEDLLLYLAIHLAVHHGLAGLLWYWDLALVLDRWAGVLDWEAVVVRASRWRVGHAVFFALLGLEIFFGVSAPPSGAIRLKPRGLRAAAMNWLLRHHAMDTLAQVGHLIPLLLVDRGRDLLGSLRPVLWPRPAWVRARYAGTASSLLGQYLAHYRRMGEVMRPRCP